MADSPQTPAYSHPRRPPRLRWVVRSAPIYFVTFVTYERQRWLAVEEIHAAFRTFAEVAASEHEVFIGRYVIMPDHIHLFVRGGPEFRLGRWIGALKRTLARARPGAVRDNRLWQEGFVDHLVRHDESLDEKWTYVRENPVRAGLVARTDDWPFAGCIHVLDHAEA
jgi:putative transposase